MRSRRGEAAALVIALVLGCGDESSSTDTDATASTGARGSTTGEVAPGSSTDGGAVATSTTTGGDDSSSGQGTFGISGGEPRPEPCPEPGPDGLAPPTLEVGYGDGDFFDVGSGPARLVMGPQGGFHIVLGLRGAGFDVADWGTAHLRAELAGRVVGEHDAVAAFACRDDLDPVVAEALWVNLLFDVDPDQLLGQTIDVTVEVTDWTGASATRALTLTIDQTLG